MPGYARAQYVTDLSGISHASSLVQGVTIMMILLIMMGFKSHQLNQVPFVLNEL